MRAADPVLLEEQVTAASVQCGPETALAFGSGKKGQQARKKSRSALSKEERRVQAAAHTVAGMRINWKKIGQVRGLSVLQPFLRPSRS